VQGDIVETAIANTLLRSVCELGTMTPLRCHACEQTAIALPMLVSDVGLDATIDVVGIVSLRRACLEIIHWPEARWHWCALRVQCLRPLHVWCQLVRIGNEASAHVAVRKRWRRQGVWRWWSRRERRRRRRRWRWWWWGKSSVQCNHVGGRRQGR